MSQAALAIFSWFLGMLSSPVAALVARSLWGPKLTATFCPGDSIDTFYLTETNQAKIPGRFFRIKVVNEKYNVAHNCRAYLVNVERHVRNDQWERTDYRDTIPLNWSYHRDEDAYAGIDIPRGVDQHIDVIAAWSNRDCFDLQTKPPANQYLDLLKGKTEEYRLTVKVWANRLRAETVRVYAKRNNTWSKSEAWNEQAWKRRFSRRTKENAQSPIDP